MRSITLALMLFLSSAVLAACSQEMTVEDATEIVGSRDDLDGIVTPGDQPPTPSEVSEYVEKEAVVERVDVVILESFPVQARAIASGLLSDGCTVISHHEQTQVENTFLITLFTRRPVDRECTEAVVPYEESMALDVRDLPAGEYQVEVNGVSASFRLDVDNRLPEEGATDRCPRGVGDQALFTNEEAGFCLLFPGNFEVRDDEAPGVVGFYGPPKDDTMEPARAILYVNYREEVGNRSLSEIAVAHAEGYADQEVDIITEGVTLDGRPATIVAGAGEMYRTIEIMAINNDLVYALTAMPFDEELPDVEEDFNTVWDLARESFRFIR